MHNDRRIRSWLPTLLLAAPLAACASAPTPADSALDDASNAPDITDDATDSAFTPPSVTFGDCPATVQITGAHLACAVVPLPLDYDHPDADRIDEHVYRARGDAPDGRALWVLLGGPGQAAQGGFGVATMLIARDPGLTVYLADHRGTGDSARLGCPEQEDPASPGGFGVTPQEWQHCRDAVVAANGEHLAQFTTTNAARDVDALIQGTAAPGDRVFVLGISYGTYLLNRLLQVHRAPLAGVLFDSICSPGACYISEQDAQEDRVARQILARCTADAICAAHVDGNDAVAALTALEGRLAQGFCPIAGTSDPGLARSLFGAMMFSSALRRLTPAVIHRWSRCNGADRTVLNHTVTAVLGDITGRDPGPVNPALVGWSFALGVNIVASELWEPSNPGLDELLMRWNDALAARGAAVSNVFGVDGWPRYVEPHATELATTDVPVLAMNADLDTATPVEIARPLGMRFDGPFQHYVEIPGAAHTVLAQGPLASRLDSTCGRELALQFLRDPHATLDTACLADTVPLGFAPSAALTMQIFGTTDLWGD